MKHTYMYPECYPSRARQNPSPGHRLAKNRWRRRSRYELLRSASSSQIISCCVVIWWCLLRSSPRRPWPRPSPPFEGSTNRSYILLLLPLPLVHLPPSLVFSKTLGGGNNIININKHAVLAFRSVSQTLH